MTAARDEVRFGLTLHRPWAAIVIGGSKDIENRGWKPPPWIVGQRIAIHAGKKFDEAGWQAARAIMMARDEDTVAPLLWEMNKEKMQIIGTARVVGYVQRLDPQTGGPTASSPVLMDWLDSPWFFGDFGWVLSDRRALARPVGCKGAQKLWKLDDETRVAVEAQL